MTSTLTFDNLAVYAFGFEFDPIGFGLRPNYT